MTRAFSLLELSIVLVLVGLMAGAGLSVFGSSTSGRCYEETEAQLRDIDAALTQFITANTRLPIPARADIGSSNAAYGTEASLPSAGVVSTAGILIGALPHAALNLPSEMANDCWGSKFTYAVTESLTSSNPATGYPSAAMGVITLNAGTLGAPQPLTAQASHLVISHGQDKFGATPISAADIAARHCNGSAEAKIDRENCNHDATFFNSTRNTGDAGNYFDDLVVFGAKLPAPAPCAVQVVNWLGDCTGTSSLLAHGGSESVPNVASGFTGSVTVGCAHGLLTTSSPSCAASVDPCTPDGAPPGSGGCCNGDSDGNGTCGTQAGCFGSFSVMFAYSGDCTGPTEDVLLSCDTPGTGAPEFMYGTDSSPAHCGSIPQSIDWQYVCVPCP